MWSMDFDFAMTTSSIMWVATKWISYGLPYNTEYMAAKDKNQYLKGEGIGARVCHVWIGAQEDIFASL